MGHAVIVLHVSERRACRAIGQIRASARYVPRPNPFREPLRQRIIALAREYGRYGYRTVTDLLRREGWDVGKDRVYTIWRHEGLFLDMEGGYGEMWASSWHCVNCGHTHDPVIERNRLAQQEKVMVLPGVEPDYQDDEVHLGAESFIRIAA